MSQAEVFKQLHQGPEILVLPPDHPVPLPGSGFLRAVEYSDNLDGKGPALRVILERD